MAPGGKSRESMSSRLPEDRTVALVTGAAGGIGSAICKELGDRGYRIVACGRSEKRLATLAASVSKGGGECKTRAFDVADAQACENAVAWVEESLGRLDVLVNNAGTWFYEPLLQSTDQHWRHVLEVNVVAAARLARLAAPLLRRSRRPRIVNIGSKNGFLGEPDLSSYDVSKAALAALTRSLAFELAEFGILVNCVAPGVIDTDSNARVLQDPTASAASRQRIPLGRFGAAEEVAQAVGFFCGEECSLATGSTLLLDGGQLAGERL
jgi:NAD(P)-dependent dehydrogenase (short-subunit alcohol dehydrogenase family)